MKVTAVIPAAGRGERMKSEVHKLFLPLLDRPVLAHTLNVFEACAIIDDIIVVLSDDVIVQCTAEIVEAFGYHKVVKIVPGGERRQDSVYNGLMAIGGECDVVVIHDGARPFVMTELIERSVEFCTDYKAVITAVPPKDTIKRGENGFVFSTLDRSRLWSVQTPQAFQYETILKAHQRAREDLFEGTDDASLVERMGEPVKILEGSYDNFKITTSEDLYLAERIMQRRKR
jgi:2-C-methyl-D-erythritol 4-phosphate cytidylyltransferase